MTTTINTTDQLNSSQRCAFFETLRFVCYRGTREVKNLQITSFDDGPEVLVSLEVGEKNDEGTMAEYWRSYYSFFIGARGGIYDYTNSGKQYYKYYEVRDQHRFF